MITYEQMAEVHDRLSVHLHQNFYEFCEWLNILKELEPKVYIEIGIFKMGSAQMVLEFIPSVELLIGIDTDDLTLQEPEATKIKQYGDRIEFICGNSNHPETVSKAKEVLAGRMADAMFIDGNHEYDYVEKDFRLYRPLIRRKGKIGLHDCQLVDVSDVVLAEGSQRFWNELSSDHPERCRLIDTEPGPWGNYGIGVFDNEPVHA